MSRAIALCLLLSCCAVTAEAARKARTSASAPEPTRASIFAKLPDWTGYWDTEWVRAVTNPSGRDEDLSFTAVAKHARLLGHPPYNAEWEKRYQDDLRNAGVDAANRKRCDWRDFPLAMEAPTTIQVLITPEETVMLFHVGVVRHIFTDGRLHPSANDLWPTRMGHSIGRWKNGELTIDTIARTPGPAFVGPSADLSEVAHFVEHLRMVDQNTLEDRMTIRDPQRFTKPWELTIRYSRAVGLDRMIEWDCDNDRHPVVDGKLVVAPP
jgi:hypothetical protein